MKLLKLAALFVIFIITGCATEKGRPESRLMRVTGDDFALVFYEHCLFSKGIAAKELDDGKIRGEFRMVGKYQVSDFSVLEMNVTIKEANGHDLAIFESCAKTTKNTFNSFSASLMKDSGRSFPKEGKPFVVTGPLFPVRQVTFEPNYPAHMEIKQLESHSNGSARYLVKYWDHDLRLHRLSATLLFFREDTYVRLADGVILELGPVSSDGSFTGRILPNK